MSRLIFRVLLIGLAGAIALAGWLYHFTGQPLTLPSASHDLVIEHGSSLRSISQQLVDEKLLAEPWSFMLLVRFSGKAAALQAGNYRLQQGMTPMDLYRMITAGDTVQSSITLILLLWISFFSMQKAIKEAFLIIKPMSFTGDRFRKDIFWFE